MELLTIKDARRLALARAGLLKPQWTGLKNGRTLASAQAIIERFGYLQLDTVSIAGARSHAIVLLSRMAGLDPQLPETLLQPGASLFEYWGHEASWIPLSLYGCFEFRRSAYKAHPWWGDVITEHSDVAKKLLSRIREEGPIRSVDMEGRGSRGWWDLKLSKRVAAALWSCGELAIKSRNNFQRTFDLTERVIPKSKINGAKDLQYSLQTLLLKALDGHGFATTATLAATWRLKNMRPQIAAALAQLCEEGRVVPCAISAEKNITGWIRPKDLELASRLKRVRPRADLGVLLSPFDPLLWDRARVKLLFGFDQVLEIFKPAHKRCYGYYCLPVLAGERLIARYDLKAHKKQGILQVLSARFEETKPGAADRAAASAALARYADALALKPT